MPIRYQRSSRKDAVRDHLREIAVGRGDDADVDSERLLSADPLERAVLEHAQQPHLRVERQLANLVEEQRAAVGALEPARGAWRPRR